MNLSDDKLNLMTEKIIGCAYQVGKKLGFGFLEKVYENALFVALTRAGLKVQQQHPITVRFEGVVVGEYYADLLVEDCILIELKTAKVIDESFKAQCVNYLKATGFQICLLINFGPSVEIKRLKN